MNIVQGQRQRPSLLMLGRGCAAETTARKGRLTGILRPARALPKRCHAGTLMNAQPQLGYQGTRPWAGAASGGCETRLQLRECAPATV